MPLVFEMLSCRDCFLPPIRNHHHHHHPPPPALPPLRSRTYSGSSSAGCSAPGSPTNNTSEGGTPSQLRRRQTLRLDDGDMNKLRRDTSFGSQASLQHHNNGCALPSPSVYGSGSGSSVGSNSSPQRRPTRPDQQNPTFTLTHLIQSLIVFTIFYLVYDAHHKVHLAQTRLEQYREEEKMLVAQMDRIEQRALQLQEQLKKLREDHLEAKFAGTGHKLPTAAEAAAAHKAESAHLKQEISSVQRQSQVVDSEVRGLQDFLQQQARKSLASKYGEGKAIQLTLGLGLKQDDDSDSTPKEITFEFFQETPYATYIMLEQVEVGDWKGAHFTEHPNHLIRAEPVKKQPSDAPMLKMEFVEKPGSYHQHKAWTVGLTPDGKSYSLYFNLSDNTKRHRGDICLGKIVGGFDALQDLMHIEAKEEDQFRMSKKVEITSLNVVSTRQSKIRGS
mmetsp:Transcript_50705/g.75803  ORF Transcript_50705/g.75803 Transcript_50705/m.75803 type:complete len:446 (-) Transcript_50705:188-1525(-)